MFEQSKIFLQLKTVCASSKNLYADINSSQGAYNIVFHEHGFVVQKVQSTSDYQDTLRTAFEIIVEEASYHRYYSCWIRNKFSQIVVTLECYFDLELKCVELKFEDNLIKIFKANQKPKKRLYSYKELFKGFQ